MARTPRSGGPRATQQIKANAVPVALALANNPAYADVVSAANEADVIQRINARYAAEHKSESVANLLFIGAMVEHAIESKIIPADGVNAWVEGNIRYTLSYVRMGRRFHIQRDLINPSIDWYQREDARRDETGFEFRVGQPTGVVLVRDALKGYREYIRAGGMDGALDIVDQKFPMVKPVVEKDPVRDLNPAKQRLRLETIFVHLLNAVSKGGGPGSDITKWAAQWPTILDFLNWSANAPFSLEQDTAQFEAHGLPVDMKWGDAVLTGDPPVAHADGAEATDTDVATTATRRSRVRIVWITTNGRQRSERPYESEGRARGVARRAGYNPDDYTIVPDGEEFRLELRNGVLPRQG